VRKELRRVTRDIKSMLRNVLWREVASKSKQNMPSMQILVLWLRNF
jgi:hypothetical protein